MIVAAGEAPVDDFHGADLDDAVPLFRLQAGGFGIQCHLSHDSLSPPLRARLSMPRLASWSARSLPSWPLCPRTHCQSISWRAAASSRACHRSTFLTGLRAAVRQPLRSEEHTSELQSRGHLVCRLLLGKK